MSLSFKQKLIGGILLSALLPMMAMGAFSFYLSFHSSQETALRGLDGIQDGTVQRLEAYLDTIRSQLKEQGDRPFVHAALHDFAAAEEEFDSGTVAVDMAKVRARYATQQEKTPGTQPGDVQKWIPQDPKVLALQYLYMANNPNPLGEKQKLDDAGDGSTYSKVHAKYHHVFRDFVELYGYYDYFLVDAASGLVVYTNFKEMDYMSNVKTGPLADTDFSRVAKQALASSDPKAVFFTDIKPYLPSYGAAAIFGAVPLVENGKTVGAVVLQIPTDKLHGIFEPLKKVGDTVDGFLAGEDLKYRTDQTAEDGKAGEAMPAEQARAAKQIFETGKEGMYAYLGADGGPMHGSFDIIDLGNGVKWLLVVGIDDAEMLAATYEQMKIMIAVILGVAVLLSLVGWWLANALAKPVQRLSIGFFKGAEKVAQSTGQVSEAVSAMVAASEETSAQSQVIRQNSKEASGYVGSVSTAVEELNISIHDISKSIMETNQLIDEAVTKAQHTDEVVRKLGESSKKIDEVVGLINSLAEQTNLLALNAAIEAARAGDAGRGFAVVADEVKKLASHTSQATIDIREQVHEVQEVSGQSVQALAAVVEAIHRIRDNATTVSAAVEEQSGVVRQITGSVQDAAQRVQRVDENMTGIEQAARDTGIAADQVSGSSGEVQQAFGEMKSQMEKAMTDMGLKR